MNTFGFNYDNIMALAKEADYKKIMIMRDTWTDGSWCIVNKVVLKPGGKYGFAYGRIHYRNGNEYTGSINCAGTFSWRTIKVLNENMEVEQL